MLQSLPILFKFPEHNCPIVTSHLTPPVLFVFALTTVCTCDVPEVEFEEKEEVSVMYRKNGLQF